MENAKEIKFEHTAVAVGTGNALFSSFASSWTAVHHHHHQQRQHQVDSREFSLIRKYLKTVKISCEKFLFFI